MVPREADLLGKIVGQNINEVAISVLVKERLVCELGIFVAQTRRRLGIDRRAVVVDVEMEMEC